MTTAAGRAVHDESRRRRSAATFAPVGWRPEPRQLMAAATVAAFAVGLWTVGAVPLRVVAVLLVAEAVLMGLPWRVPRGGRSGASIWAETLAGLVAPLGALVLTACTAPQWLTRSAEWWWFAVALAVGAGLVVLSGLRPAGLFTGELAFVLGPTPRSHGSARAFAGAVGAVGEEILFRAPVLMVADPALLGLLAATAFVAQHHIQPGANRRGTVRSTAVEIAGAVALLALTLASQSVYPALLAHLVNNIPQIVIELQRENEDRSWS
ncbi:CPBP family glutamic-type intramembrane protease [Streptomyces sp. CA2R101]|uniref:CPBP family glutamic-type intramembrane protease n=1 Tax=Streptomyces sp. CA2R101 TaxID=3120152 RepID=UPI0030088814